MEIPSSSYLGMQKSNWYHIGGCDLVNIKGDWTALQYVSFMDQFLLCEGLLSKLNVFDNIPVVLEKVDDRFIQASLFGEILSN